MSGHDQRKPPATTSRRTLLTEALLTQALWGAGCVSLGAAPTAPTAPTGAEHADAPHEPPLRSLLRRNRELRPDFAGGLSNHLSMGLYSLSSLGGTPADLERYAAAHWPALEALPTEPGPSIDTESWTRWLGKPEALNGFRRFFRAELARLGRDATLRAYLPGLSPGIGAAAFHALIRTGYGVRFGDDDEVTDGLAYWATAFLSLGALGPPGRERDPLSLLARIHETPSLAGRELPGRLISDHMRAAAVSPAFAPAVSSLAVSEATLADLAGASLRLYLQSGDFTALHAVTATHAYRLLAPFIDPAAQGLRYHWQALAAAYVSVGAPALAAPASGQSPPWKATIQKALSSLDDHDLKLVEIAREEESFYQEPLYRRAAARRMRLI
jgi:hypothetical protein